MLTKPHRQEALSRAYVQAIAAHCGLSYDGRNTDYGIDLTLYEISNQDGRHAETGVQVDIQLKSTTAASIGAEHIRYDLEVKAYNDLRSTTVWIPRLLVVYVFPEAEVDWLNCSEEHLILRRGAYWLSLSGRPPIKNRRTVRVAIPRTNLFSVEGLQGLMKRLREGELL